MISHRAFSFVTFATLLPPLILASFGPTGDLNIVNAEVSPDGFNRSAVTAGGNAVGVLITGNKGDNFQINVVNGLTDSTMLRSTSIHWHGFFQKGTNWADGSAFVTQCPIAANNSFLYDFTVPDQAGTFWYHSHLSTQYCDGLRGPLVVYDPDDPYSGQYDVDNETTIITLSDWYHTPAKSAGNFPTFDSVIINGLGRWTGSTESTPLSVITVEKGKRYRMRLVSISCDPNFTFQIDGHTNLTIIEVDGINHQPLSVDEIQIFAGQRYSFILNADQDVGNYWIRADPNFGTTGFSGGVNSAILRYVGAEEEEPTTSQDTSSNPLVEANLIPLVNPTAPGTAVAGGADVLINLALGFNATTLGFTVNGYDFVPPTVPVLLQILSGSLQATDLLPNGSVYTLPSNSVVELSMPAGVAGGPHPFHLHGHTFSVVRSAGSTTYNYANPPQRDVVSIGAAGDNVTVRFTTDNPGPWYLHCHIDWHLEAGLAIVFAEDTADVASANAVTTAWDNLCPTYDALDSSQL